MRYVLIAVLFVLIQTGCENTQTAIITEDVRNNTIRAIAYGRNARTDLCFAIVRSMADSTLYTVSIANVPCTEKVLAQIR